MPRAFADLTATELAMFRRRLDTPSKIQQFLDGITYNLESYGDTFRSPRRVLRDRTANCIEGAVLAAAALRVQRNPPLIMDLTAVRDEDHVIAVFRRRGLWGAVGTSKFTGCVTASPSTAPCVSSPCRISSITTTWPGSARSGATAAPSTWPASTICTG